MLSFVYIAYESQQDKHSHIFACKYAWSALARSKIRLCVKGDEHRINFYFQLLGPVVRRPISANQGLNFNPGLFFLSSKVFSWTIFPILFRVANHQIVDKKN